MCSRHMAQTQQGPRGVWPCRVFSPSTGGAPQWRCRHHVSGRANAAALMRGLPCGVRIVTFFVSCFALLPCELCRCAVAPAAGRVSSGGLPAPGCLFSTGGGPTPQCGPKFAPQSVRADCIVGPHFFGARFSARRRRRFWGRPFFRALPEPSSCGQNFFSVTSSVQLPSSRPALPPRAELRARA